MINEFPSLCISCKLARERIIQDYCKSHLKIRKENCSELMYDGHEVGLFIMKLPDLTERAIFPSILNASSWNFSKYVCLEKNMLPFLKR